MTKHLLAGFAFAVSFIAGIASAKAEPVVWANTYTDYTYQKGFKGNPLEELKSHTGTVGLEGGLSTSFLDAYGFSEYNATLDTQFTKANGHMNMWKGVSLYGQWSDFSDKTNFNESQYTVGAGFMNLKGKDWSFKPLVGVNYTVNTFETDTKPVVGWSGHMVLPEGALLTNWHESRIVHGELTANGAIGLFQDITKNMYVGAQYRYYYNDAGVSGYGDALMLRLGYHL